MQNESFLVVVQVTLSCKTVNPHHLDTAWLMNPGPNQPIRTRTCRASFTIKSSSLASLQCLATCHCSRQHIAQYSVRVMMSSIKVRAGHAPVFVHYITPNALWSVGPPVGHVCTCRLTCNCCTYLSERLRGPPLSPPTSHSQPCLPTLSAEPVINGTANAGGNVIADKFHA